MHVLRRGFSKPEGSLLAAYPLQFNTVDIAAWHGEQRLLKEAAKGWHKLKTGDPLPLVSCVVECLPANHESCGARIAGTQRRGLTLSQAEGQASTNTKGVLYMSLYTFYYRCVYIYIYVYMYV